jgi:hypothetical protein
LWLAVRSRTSDANEEDDSLCLPVGSIGGNRAASEPEGHSRSCPKSASVRSRWFEDADGQVCGRADLTLKPALRRPCGKCGRAVPPWGRRRGNPSRPEGMVFHKKRVVPFYHVGRVVLAKLDVGRCARSGPCGGLVSGRGIGKPSSSTPHPRYGAGYEQFDRNFGVSPSGTTLGPPRLRASRANPVQMPFTYH